MPVYKMTYEFSWGGGEHAAGMYRTTKTFWAVNKKHGLATGNADARNYPCYRERMKQGIPVSVSVNFAKGCV